MIIRKTYNDYKPNLLVPWECYGMLVDLRIVMLPLNGLNYYHS